MKMNVDIKTKLQPNQSVVETVLKERGLDRTWLRAGKKHLLDGSKMRNFEKGRDLLLANLNKKIALYLDSDTDGFSSSAIMYMWLKEKYGVEAEVIIPEGKVHGILKHLIPDDIDLLVVPDASSSEALIHRELMAKGIDILVLDHHEFNLEHGEEAVVINPQHPDCPYENKSISGTGVVYKFVEAIDKEEGVDFHSKYIDLAAIATVADVMDMTTMDNKAIINIGLNNVKNPYFKEYHKFDRRIQDKKIDPIVVGFYMVPPINALIRVGTLEDKRDLFEAITGQVAPQSMVAGIGKIRNRQNSAKDPIIARIALTLQQTPGSKDHAVIMTTAPFNTPRAMTGLIAGQMTNMFLRPVFLGQIQDGNLTGSARNVNNSSIEDLKSFCNDSGLFNWAAGHESAFGYSIPEKNIEKFLEHCDDNLPEYEPTYHADFEISELEDKAKVIEESTELEHHVGPGFPQLVVYDEIVVRPSDIYILGKNKNVLKINARGLEYIAFGFSGDLPMDISTWKIVGKPSMNYFMGSATPQIKMDSWTIEPFEL